MSQAIVFVEHHNGTARAASAQWVGAALAAGHGVIAVVAGIGAAEAAAALGKIGVTKAIALAGAPQHSADAVARDIAKVVRDNGAKAFLAAATATGKDIAPRVAALLDSTLFSDITALTAPGGALTVVRPWLAGKVIATLTSNAPVFCATTRLNVFAAAAVSDKLSEVVKMAASTDGKVVV